MTAALFAFALIQFTNVVDYMLAMPLGVEITKYFAISPKEFSFMVSAYGVCAGLSALGMGFFVDHVSRRKLLLAAYAGFVAGTFACGLAPTFGWLLVARALTGAFAGLTAPLIMALISEGFPEEKRGRAFGIVMAGFALASVFGVPFGLRLAVLSSWRLPFLVTAAAGVLVWPVSYWALSRLGAAEPGRLPPSTGASLTDAHHGQAFLLMILLTVAQMAIVPFVGPFLVKTTDLPEEQLPLVFGVAGLVTLVVAPLVGSLSDRLGRRKVYAVIDAGVIAVILVLTHRSNTTAASASTLVALFMALIAGRFVVATALVTSWVDPRIRAGFFSFNSAFQQLASGLAALLGGFLLRDVGGRLEGYARLGWVAVAFSVATAVLFHRMARRLALASLVLFGAFAPVAWADKVTFSHRADLSAYGLYRYINEAGLTENQTPKDGVFVGQFLGDLDYRNFELEVQPEYIHHVGDGIGPSLQDPASLSLAPPKRWFPWEHKFRTTGHQEAYLDFERLNLSYQGSAFQAYVGRKPVSFGTLKLMPVWNKFTRPSPIAVGPEAIVFNQDGGGFRAQFGEVSFSGTEVKGSNTDQDASIAELAWFSPVVEVHLLASQWWKTSVFGVALAKDVAGATLRAEGLGIGPDLRTQVATPTNLPWRGQAGAGVEYAFTDKFSAIAEGLWQQLGATSVDQYQLAPSDPFQIMRARWYSIEQLKYKFSNTLTTTASLVGNWVDYSQYGLFNADYSFNQSTDLIFTVSGPLGKKGEEFSARTFDFPDGSLLGSPFQLALALQTTF